MKIFWNLLKVQFITLLTGNETTKKKKKISVIARVALIAFVCIFVSVEYSYLFFMNIARSAGNYGLYIIVLLALVMVFVGGISMALGTLYEFKDFDLLMSYPIPKKVIVLSKLLSLYLIELLYAAFVIIPAIILFGTHYMMDISFYVLGILGVFFFPMIPMVISSILCYILRRITAKMKHQKLVMNLLGVGAFAAYFIAIFSINFNQGAGESLSFVGSMVDYLPNVKWYLEGLLEPSIGKYILFVVANIVVIALFVWIFTSSIIKINADLRSSGYHEKNFKIKNVKSSSTLKVLITKEVNKFFSNFMYLLNMAFPQVTILIIAGAAIFYHNDPIVADLLEVVKSDDELLKTVAMIVYLVIFATALLTPVASVTISLEGKQLWILKSFPINEKTIFFSKGFTNFIIIFIPSFILLVVLQWLVGFPIYLFLIGILVLILSAAFVPLLGLIINLRFPKLNFEREAVVIKQSMSSFISIMLGLALSALVFFIYFKYLFLNANALTVIFVFVGGLLILDIILFIILNTYGISKFKRLYN